MARMRETGRLALAVLCAAAAWGCGDGLGAPRDLTGEWDGVWKGSSGASSLNRGDLHLDLVQRGDTLRSTGTIALPTVNGSQLVLISGRGRYAAPTV